MCNLYRVYTSQEEIRGATRAMVDSIGNMEPEIEVWPDRMAPIVQYGSKARAGDGTVGDAEL